ncbi:MAG: type II secretion system protein GspE [Gammaproteobacteria bacterium RIFCSPLOWO2_02_FULL_42_14]|nr:MAG: type II secretion system protein GspE [Gammaproteobacteria bacterium RIFCSPHIGHO2_02_FULL_42_43]OGT28985.1 MAG: type II secretion system protein GspE [Gammaproteobacteria bacterium RIFCSPHIGHO2_01_FULL_42_8]OGT51729.1 MAG: type II secretion system protein GspE [Gammaproteobacteria bacterium RIFCSPHIGHO2_12_FULL_41_25]OGT61626.1 MAG: type II secretion system protein GspE [Gammaproteobacteria bacterium RIFCSPLOWO2_02_FULL_42_14]OGT86250.1 MAG: type II secretion system protein GspE [Gammap
MNTEIHSARRLPFQFAKRHRVFLKSEDKNQAEICYLDSVTPETLIELRRFFQKPLRFILVSSNDFEALLSRAYETTTSSAMAAMSNIEEDVDLQTMMASMPKTTDLLETENDAPVIRLINAILTQAIKQSASDIHFETFNEKLAVRFRIDGVLREVLEPPRALAPLLTSRVKVMSKLDIAEKRLPQDGRISLKIAGRSVDVRVSTIPTQHGERIVLRLLDQASAPLDLTKLGMSEKTLAVTKKLIERPHGILLMTGPTGSGKTTTLYAILTALNDVSRNILTVEDPIEYYLPGIGQTQVNTKIGMTFARGLRAILRQDPDIVMVGEIRDLETVEMAIQASLTGHLVLSTLHTNTAIGAIARLRDMGAESFLLASTIIGVAAQRLVRVLCSQCKRKETADDAMKKILCVADLNAPVDIYFPVGCDQCGQTGYRGRTSIYEVVAIDEKLHAMIHRNDSEADMEAHARQFSDSMRQDGFRKVMLGETTLEEVLRVTAED